MRPVVAMLFVAACGGGGDDPPAVDAPGGPALVSVSCGDEVATIDSLATRFEPMSVTVSVGDVVALDAGEVNEDHDIVSNSPNATGLEVGGGDVGCFRFDEAGTFGFRCSIHGFVGTVVVQ